MLIDEDNIPEAAHTLRRYLEYLMDSMARKLHAKTFHKDRYELGELLDASNVTVQQSSEKSNGVC